MTTAAPLPPSVTDPDNLRPHRKYRVVVARFDDPRSAPVAAFTAKYIGAEIVEIDGLPARVLTWEAGGGFVKTVGQFRAYEARIWHDPDSGRAGWRAIAKLTTAELAQHLAALIEDAYRGDDAK